MSRTARAAARSRRAASPIPLVAPAQEGRQIEVVFLVDQRRELRSDLALGTPAELAVLRRLAGRLDAVVRVAPTVAWLDPEPIAVGRRPRTRTASQRVALGAAAEVEAGRDDRDLDLVLQPRVDHRA